MKQFASWQDAEHVSLPRWAKLVTRCALHSIFPAPPQPQTCHYEARVSRFHEQSSLQRGTKPWKKNQEQCSDGERLVLRSPGMVFSKHHQGSIWHQGEEKRQAPLMICPSHYLFNTSTSNCQLSVTAYARYPLSCFVIPWQLSSRFAIWKWHEGNIKLQQQEKNNSNNSYVL